MLPLLVTTVVPSSSFWNQPIDLILNDLLLLFGWIPIAVVLIWGFIQVWQNNQQGKYVGSLKWVLLAVDIPTLTEQTPRALEHLFSQLIGGYSDLTWKEKWIIGKVQATYSFEIASTEGYVQFYVRTQKRFRDVIEAGIYAQYPDAEISEAEDYVNWAPETYPNGQWEVWGSELKLKKETYLPIRTYVDFEDKLSGDIKDPLAQILEGMSKMKPGEHFWYQIIVQPQGNDWRKAGEKFINKIYGVEEKHKKSAIMTGLQGIMELPSLAVQELTGANVTGMLFGEEHHEEADQWKAFKLTSAEKEQADGVLRKIAKIGHAVKVRMVYVAHTDVYNKNARTAFVKGFLALYSHLNWNAYGLSSHVTPKDDYFWQRWEYTGRQSKLIKAYKNRSWGAGNDPHYLNVEELASLWHFPMENTKAPLTKRAEARRGEAPRGLPATIDESDRHAGPPKEGPMNTYKPFPLPSPGAFDDHHGHGGGHGGGHDASGGGHGAGAAHQGSAHAPSGHGAADHALSHDDHGHTSEEGAVPHVVSPTGHAELHVPHTESVHTHVLPSVSDVMHGAGVHAEEEHEDGLDTTDDMGPPADVVLPGPPPGWKDEETSVSPSSPVSSHKKDEPPMNLPM